MKRQSAEQRIKNWVIVGQDILIKVNPWTSARHPNLIQCHRTSGADLVSTPVMKSVVHAEDGHNSRKSKSGN